MDQSDGALAQVEWRDGFRDVLEDLKYLISPPRGNSEDSTIQLYWEVCIYTYTHSHFRLSHNMEIYILHLLTSWYVIVLIVNL